jgi:hypothetical protein
MEEKRLRGKETGKQRERDITRDTQREKHLLRESTKEIGVKEWEKSGGKRHRADRG